MVPVHSDLSVQLLRLAPPQGTAEHARYLRYVAVYARLQERIAALRQHLDQLQSQIDACLVVGSAQALDTALDLSEQVVADTADIAQLHVFVAHYALRLQSLQQAP